MTNEQASEILWEMKDYPRLNQDGVGLLKQAIKTIMSNNAAREYELGLARGVLKKLSDGRIYTVK